MRFKHHLIVIVTLLAVIGCSAVKHARKHSELIRESNLKIVKNTESGEKVTVTDTTVKIQAPVENSRNQVTDSSYLCTSLAWSSAVCRDGSIDHRIGNFPEINAPSRIVYRDRWHTVRDTIIRSDTARVTDTEYIERQVTPFMTRLWAVAGKLLLIVAAAGLLWRKLFGKWK